MIADNEGSPSDDLLAKLDAALADMPPPIAPSKRQLIIALKGKIKREVAKGRSMKSLRDVIASAGCDVPLATFRDYVYNGKPSRAAKVSKDTKVRAQNQKGEIPKVTTSHFILPDDATEATAGGLPVRARKLL